MYQIAGKQNEFYFYIVVITSTDNKLIFRPSWWGCGVGETGCLRSGQVRETLFFFYKQPPYKQQALEASKR